MPIVKKNDVLPERPVVIVLYGVPGSGKTSVATTAFPRSLNFQEQYVKRLIAVMRLIPISLC